MPDPLLYVIFGAIVIVLLGVDLFVVQRNPHAVSIREAAVWSCIWIGVSILFGLFIPQLHSTGGPDAVLNYFTGYVIEKSLSVDNVFLFVVIFSTFAVPRDVQHRVLFYGVLGAIVMRTVLIVAGAELVERFHWILYVFGVFLLYVSCRTFRERNSEPDIANSKSLAFIRRFVPTTEGYRGEHFFVRENGRRIATPLFIVLVLVEVTDLVFAVDSIPAIFAVTTDPFIVLTSNIFAILGLRSLYFLLAGAADRLRYLSIGLAIILGYVGLKILTADIRGFWHPTPLQSLGVISAILAVTIVASLRATRREERAGEADAGERDEAEVSGD